MSRAVYTTKKFDKDVALAIRRGKDMSKLRVAIEQLLQRQSLARELGDHPLKGDWKGCRIYTWNPIGC